MTLRLVAAARGNRFMREILEVLAAEARELGADATLVEDFTGAAPEDRFAVVPHEWFGTVPEAAWPTPEILARTVAIGTEQPGTVWFDAAAEHGARCAAMCDISPVGRVELRRRGIAAAPLDLGWSEHWRADPAPERDVAVLFLGSANRRRDVHLGSYAEILEPHAVRLLLPPVAPKTDAAADVVLGADKHALLARTKVLLSVRAQIPPYFEWVRALEAMVNGCVLVTEHGAGHGPLVPGEHFLAGAPESLGFLADLLLRAPERRDAIATRAAELLRAERPMRRAAEQLLALAADLRQTCPGHSFPGAHGAGYAPRLPDFTDPVAAAPPPAATGADPAAKAAALRAIADRRTAAADAVRAAGGDPAAIDLVAETPAYAGAAPRVSVCIPCFGHGAEVVDALDSVAASSFEDLEVLVLDDASPDDAADRVAAWLHAHPHIPARLLRRAANHGLPAARNAMLRAARTQACLMLDADNLLLPRGLARLYAALHADPTAHFAYGVLAVRRDGAPDGQLSVDPWNPALLRERNPIDAFALVRRDRVLRLGGYTEDLRLHGWEDYDLWCAVAEAGGHGVHVPRWVGVYRRHGGSMLSVTDLDTGDLRAALAERHPRVFGADG